MKKSFPKRARSRDLLVDFERYCAKHPDERFWQALRNWSGFAFIYGTRKISHIEQGIEDTFYFEKKDN